MTIVCYCNFLNAQADSVNAAMEPQLQPERVFIFHAPKVLNTNTVELTLPKVLEFKVSHNFGDLAGSAGGIKEFFGLDNAADIRIGFQYGINQKTNVAIARYKGAGPMGKTYELAFKYLLMQQMQNVRSKPVSLGLYINESVTTMREINDPDSESYLDGQFKNRLSTLLQVLIAKKMNRVSLQLTPSLVHRNRVPAYDQNTIMALGIAMRLHLGGRYSLLFDYHHSFRKPETVTAFKSRGIKFYDPMGVGFEILTGGHVFHLNFTNATDLLENRFLSRTISSWGKGQFRWGFSVSRDFNMFRNK